MEHGNRMGTHQRPLPPLPLETGSLRSVPNQQDDTWNKEAYKEVYEQFHTQKNHTFLEAQQLQHRNFATMEVS
jgi:hypothetical protein